MKRWESLEGSPIPLGASWVEAESAYNFAIYSKHAEKVTLVFFGDDLVKPIYRYEFEHLRNKTGPIWHCRIPQALLAGARFYAYQIDGPKPGPGFEWHTFDPEKLLLDPYARDVYFSPEFDREAARRPGSNWGRAPLSVLDSREPPFCWEHEPPLRHQSDLVIYEMHVRGFTHRENSNVASQRRGTFAGVIDKIPYLQQLGVTAVELMPVFQFDPQEDNYWGYMPLSFFAPHDAYCVDSESRHQHLEFCEMVQALHRAGIEIILDVVYNHTAEGAPDGPTYSLRGIDNPAYYRLDPANPRRYIDTTGVGNSLNSQHPMSLRLMMDSLRYWVTEMHVDGFRFDLAPTLAREVDAVDRLSSFFTLVAQDPTLGEVKLIAEPWDVGPGGYQVGAFPPQWSEWNGQYRDVVRDFWRGEPALVDDFVARISGSRDIYARTGRKPVASINFVTAHDGFTLRDLVSYERKHNEANGQQNRDGTDDNRSANYGVEGPTDDPAILATRARQQRNLLGTLFFSQGVPMLLSGDERSRTQLGNNNAFCFDSELTWLHWHRDDLQSEDLEAFTVLCSRLRREHPVFRRRYYERDASTRPGDAHGAPGDVVFLRTDGQVMTPADQAAFVRAFGLFLNGSGLNWLDSWGRPSSDDSFLLWFNAWDQGVVITQPGTNLGTSWIGVLDTTHPRGESGVEFRAEDTFQLPGRSMLVLRCTDLDALPRLSDEVGRIGPLKAES